MYALNSTSHLTSLYFIFYYFIIYSCFHIEVYCNSFLIIDSRQKYVVFAKLESMTLNDPVTTDEATCIPKWAPNLCSLSFNVPQPCSTFYHLSEVPFMKLQLLKWYTKGLRIYRNFTPSSFMVTSLVELHINSSIDLTKIDVPFNNLRRLHLGSLYVPSPDALKHMMNMLPSLDVIRVTDDEPDIVINCIQKLDSSLLSRLCVLCVRKPYQLQLFHGSKSTYDWLYDIHILQKLESLNISRVTIMDKTKELLIVQFPVTVALPRGSFNPNNAK